MIGGRAARFAVIVVVTGALAIAAGSWAGSQLATPAEPEPPPPAPRSVSVGPAQVIVPPGWRSIPVDRSGVAGLDPDRAAAFVHKSKRIVAEFGEATDASLMPPALRAAFPGSVPPPALTQLGGRPASLYPDLPISGGADRADLAVLTTTAGVLALACPAGDDCAKELQAATVQGATTLVPSASLALALRLPTVVKRLDSSRRTHRAALRRAARGRRQGAAARRLAAAHTAAAAALRASAGTTGRPLIAGLTRTASAYAALARAASNRWHNRFIAARERIRRSESALNAALADIPRPRAAPTVRPKPAPVMSIPDIPAPGGVSLLLFAALALLAAGAGVALGTTGATTRLRQLLD